MALMFTPEDKIIMIGDSITDAGRSQPASEPHGAGYVKTVTDWLGALYPSYRLQVLNRGINGDTTRDLLGRWQTDVIAEQPQWVLIYIGVNDAWRLVEGLDDEAVRVPEFLENYRSLLTQTRNESNARMILVEPFIAETDHTDPFRNVLSEYQEAVHQVAYDYALSVVKLQSAFDRGMIYQPWRYWTTDRVHPTDVGHTLIAKEIFKIIGLTLYTTSF
ncbi:MAG: SGNH/GDSL hydrolase family protein [Chloroflexi bacterium]|nr:SGNH/GDSL hydrolase family protein [Chloroflexota bacterium]